ncbi:DUF6883 domain-containing protein [Puniceicoccus vermicola]|uniref:DUF6883 domain-containing protein n=1 Tax=Puniceicoccus vermicola TaxID=388746 RepID=UPI003CCCA784
MSPNHPRGKHKARVFETVLGISQDDWSLLEAAIRKSLSGAEWEFDGKDRYGSRFHVDLQIRLNERVGRIRTLWIVRKNENNPRLTSCFIHP